jgi:multidrug efflux pump subunit AcrA (membrane-fusion protein)
VNTNFLFASLLTIVLSAGCSNPIASTESPAAPKETKTNKEEVVLSPEQQASARIETQEVNISEEPGMLRVKGRIALDDDRIWRVGVRTLGSVMRVYANLGDHVKKGQILARYHADEVRDSRAQYRATLSELDRAKAAVAQAQRSLNRAQRLLELKAGSVQQVEQAQQDLIAAICWKTISRYPLILRLIVRMKPKTKFRSSRRAMDTSSRKMSRQARRWSCRA